MENHNLKKEEIVIGAVGDISFGDGYLCCGFGVRSRMEQCGPEYIFDEIKSDLLDNDLLFGNLEGVLSSSNFKRYSLKSFQMRGKENSIVSLRDGGFTVLSLANNHIMQHGKVAVLDTVKLLNLNGISSCGIRTNDGTCGKPYIFCQDGISIAFLAYNARPKQYFTDNPLDIPFTIDDALTDVREFKDKVHLMVVSMHWGDEFIHIPSAAQQAIAHQLVDSGVNLILGHHPHVMQGVEQYKEGLIFYSLGNFVFDMPWYPDSNKSCIARIKFHKLKKKLSYEIIPIKINGNYQPEVMSEKDGAEFLKRVEYLSNLIAEINRKYNYEEYYVTQLNHFTRRERSLSHKYWLSNIRRYPAFFLVQYMLEVLMRRIRLFRGTRSKEKK
jgi:poly-gamma-glutamate synthesis protein (capsule biosynthesis protein)